MVQWVGSNTAPRGPGLSGLGRSPFQGQLPSAPLSVGALAGSFSSPHLTLERPLPHALCLKE